jgi:hypothetical protein
MAEEDPRRLSSIDGGGNAAPNQDGHLRGEGLVLLPRSVWPGSRAGSHDEGQARPEAVPPTIDEAVESVRSQFSSSFTARAHREQKDKVSDHRSMGDGVPGGGLRMASRKDRQPRAGDGRTGVIASEYGGPDDSGRERSIWTGLALGCVMGAAAMYGAMAISMETVADEAREKQAATLERVYNAGYDMCTGDIFGATIMKGMGDG